MMYGTSKTEKIVAQAAKQQAKGKQAHNNRIDRLLANGSCMFTKAEWMRDITRCIMDLDWSADYNRAYVGTEWKADVKAFEKTLLNELTMLLVSFTK